MQVPQRRACARFMFRASAPIRKVFSTSDSGGTSCGGGTAGAPVAAGAVMADGNDASRQSMQHRLQPRARPREGRGSGCDADAASRARATLLPSSTRALRSRKHFHHKSHTAPPWSQLQLAWSPALSRSSEVSEESPCPGRVPWPHAQPRTARAAAPCHSSASLLPAHRKRCAFLSRLRAIAGRGPTRIVHCQQPRFEAVSACHTPGEASFPAARLRRA
jgi:hypothetical protein